MADAPPMDWLAYLTNGKHLAWYGSVQYTLIAALLGGVCALLFGLGGASLKRSTLPPLRLVGSAYTNMVRGIPDVLFFLFFPLAFEQLIELLISQSACSAVDLAANPGLWPPCRAANWFLSPAEYLIDRFPGRQQTSLLHRR